MKICRKMKNATFRGENVHLCEHLAGSFRIQRAHCLVNVPDF